MRLTIVLFIAIVIKHQFDQEPGLLMEHSSEMLAVGLAMLMLPWVSRQFG